MRGIDRLHSSDASPLSFEEFVFYLPFEAPWVNTKKMKRPREKGNCNAVLWLIDLKVLKAKLHEALFTGLFCTNFISGV